jgi:ATP-dependent DNA ligase
LAQQLLESLLEKFKKIIVDDAPFECEPYKGRVTWVKPKLVCKVIYMAVTPDLSLRHPRFKGLRDDKTPEECAITQILPNAKNEMRNLKINQQPETATK